MSYKSIPQNLLHIIFQDKVEKEEGNWKQSLKLEIYQGQLWGAWSVLQVPGISLYRPLLSAALHRDGNYPVVFCPSNGCLSLHSVIYNTK